MNIKRDINTVIKTTGFFAIAGLVSSPFFDQGGMSFAPILAVYCGVSVGIPIGMGIALLQEIQDCLGVEINVNIQRVVVR